MAGVGLHISQALKGRSKKALEFTQLIKAIGECKSKAEEDAIVTREVDVLKRRLADPMVDKSRMQEYLLRLVYVEMLGHSASFGYIHAVKMTHEPLVASKKVGYLATSLFLNESHDLLILIVNTLQQDLKSDNPLVVSTALTAICKLVSGETISAILPQVTELLGHPTDLVRKKAVMVLHRFYQRSPSAVAHLLPRFRTALCDKDPSVMGASLCVLHDLATQDPGPYRNLVPSFVSILKQVLERRLPKTYDYPRGNRGLPAPFIQVKLLRLMRLLGAGDATASAALYGVVGDALKAADNGTTMGHAVVAEAVKTAAALVPSAPLLAAAADSVAKLLRAKSNNLKYVGIDALCDVVVVSPAAAAAHQFAVIDCLEDPDESLRRKTLELLYRMASPGNVEVIAGRMLGYLRAGGGADSCSVEETCARVAELAERYAPSNEWFIGTMNAVFELGGPLVRPALAHGLCRLLAEGSGGEDPAGDAALRASACAAYADLLAAPKLPEVLLGVCFWALGEFGVAAGVAPPSKLQDMLADALETHAEVASAHAVQAVALTALAKIVARHGGPLSPGAAAVAAAAARSRSTDLAQRAAELQALAEAPRELAAVAYPEGSAAEAEAIDPSLPFLNAFVADALASGASPYQPPEVRTTLANPVSPAAAAAADAAAAAVAAGGGRRTQPPPAPRGLPPLSSFTTADDLDVFGMSDTPAQVAAQLPQQSPPGSPAAYEHHGTPVAAGREEPDVALNVSGPRKWGHHVTLAANPPPAARTPGSAVAGGADLLDGFGFAASPAPPPPAPPPTPAVAASPAQPAVDPQKAKLAAALFGGGAASAGAPATPFAARAARAAAGTPVAASPRPEVDLLGGLVAPPPTPAGGVATPKLQGAPQPPPQQPPRGGDPFAALAALTPPSPAAPAPFNFDALLGPAAAATPQMAPTADAFSLLSLGGMAPPAAQQPPSGMAGVVGQMQRLQPAAPTALNGGGQPKGAPPKDPFANLFS